MTVAYGFMVLNGTKYYLSNNSWGEEYSFKWQTFEELSSLPYNDSKLWLKGLYKAW